MSLQNTLFPWQKEWLWPDLIAAFVVTVLLIPQAIAYAFLAGLPPQTGLFASLLPLMAYAILGRSPSMALGPVAIISLMTIGTLADVSIPSAESYPAYAALLAGLCGAWLLVFFVAGLGTWTSFISHSVISGFTSAAAIVIIISQLKFLTGIDIPRGGSGWQPLVTIFEQWRDINLTTLAISIGALVLLLVWRLWAPRFSANLPNMLASLVRNSGALVVIVLAVSATLFWSLPVQVVGQIPTGLPHFVLPEFNQLNWRELIVPSGVMALIIYLESLAIANALARKNHQRISANQELLALGAANIAAAATQAMPVAGSFGRSVVSEHSGAKSQWASVWSALLIVLVCLFASHLFYYVPEAVLGAIISVSAWSLLNWRDGWRAWLYQRSDGAIWLTTFLLVLIRDAETGILAGVALSLVLYLRRTSKPHIAEVGVLQDSGEIRNVLRHKVHTVPGILMIRPDESLYFGNSDFLVDAVLKRVNNDKSITHVLLIGSAINHIDFSGFEALENLSQDLTKRNIYFHLAEFKGPVMDQLEKTDLLRNFSSGKVFFSVREAIHELSHSISPQSTINKYPSDDFYSI